MQLDRSAKIYLSLAVIGIAVAIFHSYQEITENFTGCLEQTGISCRSVFISGYTHIFGVPLYVFGLVWFPLAILLGLYAFSRAGSDASFSGKILLPFLLIGDIFTIYLWYVELGVIGAICPLCVSLYVINYIMTILSLKMIY